jgi:CHAD domain
VAKPRPVKGLDPDRRIRSNARKILAVRIEEVYSYDGLVADPANVKELHDLRIACKRLRYLLEIFAVAFAEDLEPFIDEVKGQQDLLGDIHDCDVQIPMLEEHLAWLAGREAEAARRVVVGRAVRQPTSEPSEAAYRAFRRRLEVGQRGAERPGVHALIARRRHERDELYARFLDEWRRLKAERFRPRLEAALGIDAG